VSRSIQAEISRATFATSDALGIGSLMCRSSSAMGVSPAWYLDGALD
jgi:hypothetical protein